jgi:hypothetical protein
MRKLLIGISVLLIILVSFMANTAKPVAPVQADSGYPPPGTVTPIPTSTPTPTATTTPTQFPTLSKTPAHGDFQYFELPCQPGKWLTFLAVNPDQSYVFEKINCRFERFSNGEYQETVWIEGVTANGWQPLPTVTLNEANTSWPESFPIPRMDRSYGIVILINDMSLYDKRYLSYVYTINLPLIIR